MSSKGGVDTLLADEMSQSFSTASPKEGRPSNNFKNDNTACLIQNDPKVRNIRKMAILVLFVAAIAVSGGVYTGLVRSEQREFENRFADQAKQIGHALTAELNNKLRALDALSVTITSFAGSQAQEWPYVTVPEFSYRAAGVLSVGRGLTVAVYPVVSKDEINQWEQYSIEHQKWLKEVVDFQTEFPDAFRPTDQSNEVDTASINMAMDKGTSHAFSDISSSMNNISEVIFHIVDGTPTSKVSDEKALIPLWQHAPVHPGLPRTNYDAFTVEHNRIALNRVIEGGTAVLGQVYELSESCYGHDLPPIDPSLETMTWVDVWEMSSGHNHHSHNSHIDHSSHIDPSGGLNGPAVNIFYPVFSEINHNRTVVAVIAMATKWDSFLLPNVPPNPNGLIMTLRNECDQRFSFEITGDEVIYLGPGEYHEADYADYEEKYELMHESAGFTHILMANEYCTYTASIYPSSRMREKFATATPMIYTSAVAVIFLFTVCVFVFYDYLVQRRQKFLVETASRSTAIISSLFPRIVRDRLLEGEGQSSPGTKSKAGSSPNYPRQSTSGAPIANFFPSTTIMFGDIAGFTAWSSSRQPSEVFTLLETLYAKFDFIAREMHVFKVETIGDCYVAVTGLPTPQEDHHLRMVKFAKRALKNMGTLTRQLEVTLGPDTTKLGFRIGLHSGPVTAGVLRGEKSRFQLFGDTVNMASRMESTGKINCIQVSHTTASLLVASGKSSWITKREDMVEAKGKGKVQTFWVKETFPEAEKKDDGTSSSSLDGDTKSPSSSSMSRNDSPAFNQNIRNPLIDWQVELLSRLLKQIVAKRASIGTATLSDPCSVWKSSGNSMPRDEIVEEVALSSFGASRSKRSAFNVDLSSKVLSQLEDFVTAVAMLYRDNRFHNYEHACHVTMGANKFLTRVVDPTQRSVANLGSSSAVQGNSYAYGLNGDPLTQFAIIFSALIHDIDHQGVSNKQLADENNRIAIMYNGKSPAEQNSIDLAFEILGSSQYRDLVSCICANEDELKRFRQLVVNCVMATDIFDKDLLAIRNEKWKKAFNSDTEASSDLRATIVIEHIMQAADVAHTMQHWHIYQKWNERLFIEMCTAYEAGRGPAKDPAEGWYEGELWFFDNYVIPLAKKLEECAVFGVSSDECLNYALDNRKEWETRGRDIVELMKARFAEMKEGK